jgi:tol-pal system protein YbgF
MFIRWRGYLEGGNGLKLLDMAVVGACAVVLIGCVTTQDLRMHRNIINEKMSTLEEHVETVEKKVDTDRAKIDDALTPIRKNIADSNADSTAIREQLQKIQGDIEALQKDIAALKHNNDDIKDLHDQMNKISLRVSSIEKSRITDKKETPEIDIKGKQNSVVTPALEKETAYVTAYNLFKNGKYDRARADFQNFLKKYPDHQYADSAQFWIAECYFSEEKYDKAILEYDKVVKNYPEGNKTSQALLKQGLAFKLLGDKTSARLLFQQVIKDYPNTSQARTAGAYLLELKSKR